MREIKINTLAISVIVIATIFIVYKSNTSFDKLKLVGESAIHYAHKEYPEIEFSMGGINYNREPQTYSVTLIDANGSSNIIVLFYEVSKYKDSDGFYISYARGGKFEGELQN